MLVFMSTCCHLSDIQEVVGSFFLNFTKNYNELESLCSTSFPVVHAKYSNEVGEFDKVLMIYLYMVNNIYQ